MRVRPIFEQFVLEENAHIRVLLCLAEQHFVQMASIEGHDALKTCTKTSEMLLECLAIIDFGSIARAKERKKQANGQPVPVCRKPGSASIGRDCAEVGRACRRPRPYCTAPSRPKPKPGGHVPQAPG